MTAYRYDGTDERVYPSVLVTDSDGHSRTLVATPSLTLDFDAAPDEHWTAAPDVTGGVPHAVVAGSAPVAAPEVLTQEVPDLTAPTRPASVGDPPESEPDTTETTGQTGDNTTK